MAIKETIKSAFESMMFVWGEPLDAKIAADAFGISKDAAEGYFRELMDEYDRQKRGIRIREVGNGYQFITAEENFDYISRICTPVKERRLTQAALEVLAIVAYRQPVSKSEIDAVRGIKSDRVLEGLIKKELVEERGKSDAIGKPVLYGTTTAFLANFDLKDLDELPDIEDIGEAIRYDESQPSGETGQAGFDFEDSNQVE